MKQIMKSAQQYVSWLIPNDIKNSHALRTNYYRSVYGDYMALPFFFSFH